MKEVGLKPGLASFKLKALGPNIDQSNRDPVASSPGIMTCRFSTTGHDFRNAILPPFLATTSPGFVRQEGVRDTVKTLNQESGDASSSSHCMTMSKSLNLSGLHVLFRKIKSLE